KNHTANDPGSNAFLLNNHSVSKNQSLLMVNNSDCGVATRLSEALQAGVVQHVNHYCRHILESPCDESMKQIQLEAKNPAGVPGLYLALKKDHAHCIQAFFEQVQCSNLDPGVIRQLLAPKGPSDDTPGLRLAMSGGYVNVVDAYCEWILKMENSDLWKQDQLEALGANPSIMPALHHALSEDSSECVTVFCQRILASDLSVQVKEKLVAAETLDFEHTPGLLKAISKDNHASVEAFCKTVLKAELAINMKRRLLESKYRGVTIMQHPGYSNFNWNRAFRLYRSTVLTSDLNFRTKLSLTSRNLNWLNFHLNPARLLHRLYYRR
ncbi:hypothetical protein, partial [Endozoicomonas sp. ONNA2]|uniref:hypothetical protein n=1 Tax=Endozoicomonas sp. ONNA2 TaxID=2828741 RepID=UPI00214849C9